MQKIIFISCFGILVLALGCKSKIRKFDATGTFEATEIIVSAQATGQILMFDAEEGENLSKGDLVAQIDDTNLTMQKEQVQATIQAVGLKKNDPAPQVAVFQKQLESAKSHINTLRTQLKTLEKEQDRIAKMHQAKAATDQQLDQIDGQVDILKEQIKTGEFQRSVVEAQIESAKISVSIQNQGITGEVYPLEKKIAQLDDQLNKTQVLNPVSGTMLTKYANAGEFVSYGKPLYKIADLSTMKLNAYVDGNQLNEIKLGQKVGIYIDQKDNAFKKYEGTISWISDQAEFTPKTIQTKDERANLVYAIKVNVVNDGFLKIGMYGEVQLNEDQSEKKI